MKEEIRKRKVRKKDEREIVKKERKERRKNN
jgi:hypothetical protein